MEEVGERPATYERKRLYEEVWAEPVKTVAERYEVIVEVWGAA